MKQSFSVQFYCRNCKKGKKGVAPVEMALSVNGKRTFMSLPRKEVPCEFDKAMASKRSNDTKDFCRLYETKVNEVVMELLSSGRQITVLSIKNGLIKGVSTQCTISEIFKETLTLMREKTKGGLTYGTYRKYELSFEEFLAIIGDKDINDVTTSEIERFIAVVSAKQKPATSRGYILRVKSAFLKARRDNKLRNDPWAGIKVKNPRQKLDILTEEEYQRIRDKRFEIPRLERVRQLFILGCNTGLSYCDMMDLKKEDIKTQDGIDYICKPRNKTGIEFTAVVLEDGKEVLSNADIDNLKISNQKLNGFLKEIQDICRIKHTLTFHKSRHFYCTSLLRKGINPAIVQRCMGHSRLSMTMHYTHIIQDDILNAFK